MSCTYHTPVLLRESIDELNIHPNGIYVDMTFGGGGHSREILSKLEAGHLFAFDQDISVLDNLPKSDNFTFTHCNFRYAFNFLRYFGVNKVDGILADLGVSSFHLDRAKRGFSFRFNHALDMRMNNSSALTAGDILNTYSAKELTRIFKNYGELYDAQKIAEKVIRFREKQAIQTTHDLVTLLQKNIQSYNDNKYLAKVFQALRIEVNKELTALEHMLLQSLKWLKPGGRLVVISYHSIEDRLVKNFIRNGLTKNITQPKKNEEHFKVINKKVIRPSIAEVKQNNRSRSAKLRIAEKLQTTN